jgi:prephenate dehydrogenase
MKVAIVGVGLVGGSIGLAARTKLDAEVSGFDASAETLTKAVEVGAIDAPAESVAAAVDGADAVFCAAPVHALPDLVREALEASADSGAVVSDVGSTKAGLVHSVEGLREASRFIGGHPLAGAETAGVENSRADLFEGARWFLTPTRSSEGVLFDRLHNLVAGIGARPQAIEPAEHDRMMATVSHLPHVLSNALVSRAADTLTGGERRPEVGRSFRDATRVAGANPDIWGAIFAANADAVADEVEAVAADLGRVAALLRDGDQEALRAYQAEAAADRRSIEEDVLEGGQLFELRIAVENRPGVVADLALALGRAGVNIEDMSLAPSSDRRTGAISLWIAGADEAVRAGGIISELGHAVTTVAGG